MYAALKKLFGTLRKSVGCLPGVQHPQQKPLLGKNEKEAIETFCALYVSKGQAPLIPVNTGFNVNRLLKHANKPTKYPLGIIAIGLERYFSPELMQRLRTYAKEELPIALLLDTAFAKEKMLEALFKEIKKGLNVRIFTAPRTLALSTRIHIAMETFPCERVVFFTLRDAINQRSFFKLTERHITTHPEAVALFLSTRDTAEHLLQKICSDPQPSGLSGVVLQKEWLQARMETMERPSEFWIAKQIFRDLSGDDCACVREKLHVANPARLMTIADIAQFFVDTREHFAQIEACGDVAAIKREMEQLLPPLEDICTLQGLSTVKQALVISGVTLLATHLAQYYTEDEFDEVKYALCAALHFDTACGFSVVHAIHQHIVERCIPVEPRTIAVLEPRNIQDLEKSICTELAKYMTVLYIAKPQYFDFPYFNSLIFRAQMQRAALIILSDRVHSFATNGKPVLCLWHGLGMLKSIQNASKLMRTKDVFYVSSSFSCKDTWAMSFETDESNILPLGNVLTDHLFDSDWVQETRINVRRKLGVQEGVQLALFAPTFRTGKPHYYSPQLDLNVLGVLLEQHNLMCVAKKHHVFAHIYSDTGTNTSGLHSSRNGAFLVDEAHDFLDLLVACDVFVTDYSSGIFYAAIMNKPLVLYAPDWEDYKKGPNGFIINYPGDFPAIFVDTPDPEQLVSAMLRAHTLVGTAEYTAFKELHVGACDGHATERVLAHIELMLAQHALTQQGGA